MDSLLHNSTDTFFNALSANKSPLKLLSYFSTTSPVSIQHAPRDCPHPTSSRLCGLNAVRSYFDLLATHWERIAVTQHSSSANSASRSVTISATVTWRWKKSGRSWNEDFTCTLEFDDHFKICHFLVTTESNSSTCVMRAVDADTPFTRPSATTVSRPNSSSPIKAASVCHSFPVYAARP